MSVKGISIQNVDPRPEPAWGLLNATESLGAAAHIWTYGDLVYAMHDVGVEPVVKPESTPGEMAGHVKRKQDLVAALDAMTDLRVLELCVRRRRLCRGAQLRHARELERDGPACGGRADLRPGAAVQRGLRHRRRERHAPRALPPGAGPDRTARRQGVRSRADAPRLLRAARLAWGRARRRSSAALRHHRRHPVTACGCASDPAVLRFHGRHPSATSEARRIAAVTWVAVAAPFRRA